MPLPDLVTQALFQGVLVTIIGVILYGRAVALLGASAGAAFGALVPALSALFAIPLLWEWPNETDWLAIALISAGVYLASGGAVPGRGATGRGEERTDRAKAKIKASVIAGQQRTIATPDRD
jgi:hypothetical protein